MADREGVEIRTYSVIYRAFEDLRDAMQGMLAPEEVEETVGEVEVRAIFQASRVGTIAGSYVTDGKVTRGAKVRLVRDGAVVYDGTIASLRRGPEDVREVAAGFECGIVLQNYADIKEGDQLEVYETRQVERTLSLGPCPANPRSSCSCASTCTSPRSARSRASGPSSTASRRICASAAARRSPRWRTRTPGSGRRWPSPLTAGSPGRCAEAADNVGRYLDARFPQGVRVERRVASWDDLESLR